MLKRKLHLTRLELEIMKVLWENGPSTVQKVQQLLSRDRPLAYTTVQTMLNLLHQKGKVERVLEERAYVYSPSVTRREEASRTLGDLIDRLFGGSAETLVLSLVDSRHLTPDGLRRVSRKLEEASRPKSRRRE